MTKTISKKDFLFEMGCEELPPKALTKLASSLHDSLASGLDSLGLSFEDSEWFATPRRLAVRFNLLDTTQQDKSVEKLGPAVAAAFDQDGKPKPAAMGFAKSNGVEVSQLSRKMTEKGERLAFIAEVKGEQTALLMQDLLEKAISQLPVPKAMRWGDSSSQFSRPVHWLLALLGDQILDIKLFGLKSSNLTYGHRFHSNQAIKIDSPSHYEQQLSNHKVVSCFEERKGKIRIQTEQLAKKVNAIAVVSESLLEEVAALVEWPIALMGKFDEEFLSVPAEALISSMAEHQKYFHLVDNENNLLPYFITVSNIDSNNPLSVVEGNEKVIRPRLADAKFFFDTDTKQTLESYSSSLKKIVFQNKLGSLFNKTQRIKSLSSQIANELGCETSLVARAADLCKNDLMTNMVGEFSDLQGIMGKYYAQKDGEDPEVASAMEEIYWPKFAGDQLPKTQTGMTLALADRIDTLVGIFGIGQIPTGAKDPFALRRAALGVLRLISENSLNLDLSDLVDQAIAGYKGLNDPVELNSNTKSKLLEFFEARSLSMYLEKGVSSQVIKSVQALNITQPTDFQTRTEAVQAFSEQEESADLAEANKRVKNILVKSDFDANTIQIDESLFDQNEKALFDTINQAESFVKEQLDEGKYKESLLKLAELKQVVNQFFDNVMINVDDEKLKNNRLALITKLRNLFLLIADISLLQK